MNNIATSSGPWREVEFALTATGDYANPYTDVDVWADFTHADGTILRRPAFYDGAGIWRIRFASPAPGRWSWTSSASVQDSGLSTATGAVEVGEASSDGNPFYDRGFWKMSPGGRSLVHADDSPVILVGDTAWGLPWRATAEDVTHYATDRQDKGFNAALLMSVQPDMGAVGPRDRTADEGFDVGFEDLPTGHITELNPSYFQYLDHLVDILVSHEIVPVWQPVFQGFGWKGLGVAGTVVPPEEYARYCRYLVARYGARPAIYLVGADGSGYEPQIAAGGQEVETWDCYAQPTGIHYRPHGDNRASQDERWLDFQWCQTGHGGEHVPERVADMWRNLPLKAVANGEPTYEHTRSEGIGPGWWQGHEAWSNLCAGGTMGVVYGAANIWQWKHHPDEPGHHPYFVAPSGGWKESLALSGSGYVGLLGKLLEGLPTTDMEPDWETFTSPRGLRVPGLLTIVYQENGGVLRPVRTDGLPFSYRIFDPKTGKQLGEGKRVPGETIPGEEGVTRVVMFYDSWT